MSEAANLREDQRGWAEFQLCGPLPGLEIFAEFMTEMGAGGAVFSECPHNKGLEMVTAFLPLADLTKGLEARIKARVFTLEQEFPGQWTELRTTRVEDRDWAREWKDSLEPERLEPGIWIVPTFKEPPPEAAKEPQIRLDPGLAFGTGKHESTRACLRLVAEATMAGAKTMLDLGTGTGILAMAAAKLGAQKIVALDIDTLALKVAKENAELNGLSDRIEFGQGVNGPDAKIEGGPFDLVAANIFAETLAKLMPLIARETKPGGTAALSGILRERLSLVEEALAANGLSEVERIEEGEWVTLALRHAESAK